MEKPKPGQPMRPEQQTKIELQKKPVILNQGCRSRSPVIMCSRLNYEGKLVYLGLGNGKILSYDPVSKLVTQVAKCNYPSSGTLGIQDLVLCSEKKLAVVDTNSTIRFFVKEKLVHTMASKCQFISNLC